MKQLSKLFSTIISMVAFVSHSHLLTMRLIQFVLDLHIWIVMNYYQCWKWSAFGLLQVYAHAVQFQCVPSDVSEIFNYLRISIWQNYSQNTDEWEKLNANQTILPSILSTHKHTDLVEKVRSGESTAQNIAHIAFNLNGECDTYLRLCIWLYEHLIFSNRKYPRSISFRLFS